MCKIGRVVHAKAAGAWGEFEVTHDISDITSAKFLAMGKKTKVLARISTVAGEKGSSDTVRDIRGWALKHFTEEGNQDFVFNDLVSGLVVARLAMLCSPSYKASILYQRPDQIPISE